MHRSLPAAIAASVAALVLAAAASTASPPASGKVDAASPAASGSQHLRNAGQTGAECPNGLACRVVPAAYEQNSADPGDYGNYDLATRPSDGLAIRYVVIHDTEYGYDPTIALFQNPLAQVESGSKDSVLNSARLGGDTGAVERGSGGHDHVGDSRRLGNHDHVRPSTWSPPSALLTCPSKSAGSALR
jgi:hypothetical protein